MEIPLNSSPPSLSSSRSRFHHGFSSANEFSARPDVPSSGGYSLVELLISLAVLVVVLVSVLALFDLNSNIARVQTDVANAQQSLRAMQQELVRNVRMAGRGPLPSFQGLDPSNPGYPGRLLPQGVAVEMRNNVPEGENELAPDLTGDESPKILPQTDVLTIRGVFETIFQTNPADRGAFEIVEIAGVPTSGKIQIPRLTQSGLLQDLSPLLDLEENDALLLVGTVEDAIYAVVELECHEGAPAECSGLADDGGTAADPTDDKVELQFTIRNGDHTTRYSALNPQGAFPFSLTAVAAVGIVEEYRYYVREKYAIAGSAESLPTPVLAKARFFPGTDVPYAGDLENLRLDIADNVLDLQVALGIDRNKDKAISPCLIDPSCVDPTPEEDEWLYNHTADDPETDDPPWGNSHLQSVRINSLVRTERADREFVQERLDGLEDRTYLYENGKEEIPPGYRWRLLQTTVELRNL